jgi:hypothetical protein
VKRGLSGKVVGVVLVAGALWLPGRPVPGQPPEAATLPNQYTVKAVFLYNFGRYVEWPNGSFADASAPFVIGIVGEDAFGGALQEIAARKTIQGRPIVVRRFASPEDYNQTCHILFVSRSLASSQQAALIRMTQRRGVLVVGETPGFAEQGGTANFFVEEDRIRFEINVDTARRAQLRLDAKLLSLGKPVSSLWAAGTQ